MTYGGTASGKTYTMMGLDAEGAVGPEESRGLAARTMACLFSRLEACGELKRATFKSVGEMLSGTAEDENAITMAEKGAEQSRRAASTAAAQRVWGSMQPRIGMRYGVLRDAAPGQPQKVLVKRVVAGSSADQAGVCIEDHIVRANGREVLCDADLAQVVASVRPGEMVSAKQCSGDLTYTVLLILKPRSTNPAALDRSAGRALSAIANLRWCGGA